MKKLIISFSFLIPFAFLLPTKAQQIPVFNHHVFYPHLYNPSFTGINQEESILLVHRQQWMGFEDAPNSTILSGQFSPLKDRPFGLGVNIARDQTFLNRRTSINLFPSVHFQLSQNQFFTLGVNVGAINYNLDFSLVEDPNIPSTLRDAQLLGGRVENEWQLDAGLGIGYQVENGLRGAKLGMALTQLASPETNISSGPYYRQYPHLLFNASFKFPLSERAYFEPAFFYKQSLGTFTRDTLQSEEINARIEGGELDAFFRLGFPEAGNLWFGLGTGLGIGSNEQTNVSNSSFWTFKGAMGVNLGENFSVNIMGGGHKYLPFSLEAGLNLVLNGPSKASGSREPICDPIWRNTVCLRNELSALSNKPRMAEVSTLIGVREVILTYRFSDRNPSYQLNEWDQVRSLLGYIKDVIERSQKGSEALGQVLGIAIIEKIQNRARTLEYASRATYAGEYGDPARVTFNLDLEEQNAEIATGNISRKDLELLKQITIFQTLNTGLSASPSYQIISDQQIDAPREFAVEIRMARIN